MRTTARRREDIRTDGSGRERDVLHDLEAAEATIARQAEAIRKIMLLLPHEILNAATGILLREVVSPELDPAKPQEPHRE